MGGTGRRCALAGCGVPIDDVIGRPQRLYCSPAHRMAARQSRRAAAQRERAEKMNRLIREDYRRSRRTRGPEPMTRLEEVEAAREALKAADQHSGERAIAKKLGISRDAVRYALGKDRREGRR